MQRFVRGDRGLVREKRKNFERKRRKVAAMPGTCGPRGKGGRLRPQEEELRRHCLPVLETLEGKGRRNEREGRGGERLGADYGYIALSERVIKGLEPH